MSQRASRSRRGGVRALHAPPISHARPGRRPRHFGTLDETERRRGRRTIATLLIAPLLAGLVALLFVPQLQVRQVRVSGNHRLTSDQVVAAAGLQHPGSVFLVDPGAVERRLEGQTWVRAATVSAQLPGRVVIRVDEWQPVAGFRAGTGPLWLVSPEAAALGLAAGSDGSGLLEIDGPSTPQPRAGAPVLDRHLLVALVNIERDLPGLIGQEVRSFAIDGCGSVTLVSKRGWQAQLGRALTPDELTALGTKVGTLKALAAAGDVNYDSPDLQYVNVMNPAYPAVKVASKPTPAPRSGVKASPAPSPTPVSQGAAACR